MEYGCTNELYQSTPLSVSAKFSTGVTGGQEFTADVTSVGVHLFVCLFVYFFIFYYTLVIRTWLIRNSGLYVHSHSKPS